MTHDPEHDDRFSPDLPTDVERAEAARIGTLLAERAGSIAPRPAPVGQLVRRANRRRHRRTSVVIGSGLAATAAIGAVVVMGRSTDGGQEVQVAGSGTAVPGPTGTTVESVVPAPGEGDPTSPFLIEPYSTSSPAPAAQPPLRMGLDVVGATATSVSDTPAADDDVQIPPSAAVDFVDDAGGRRLSVLVSFAPATDPSSTDRLVGWPSEDPLPVSVRPEPIDIGAGRQGSILRLPAMPGSTSSVVQVSVTVPGAQITPLGTSSSTALDVTVSDMVAEVSLVGTGVTEDELLTLARQLSLVLTDGPHLLVDGIPADLHAQEPRDPSIGGGGGVRSQVVYRLADGTEAVVDVVSRPGATFAAELDTVRQAPTAETYVLPVRGVDALVRRFPGMAPTGGEVITVTWLEPRGDLVTVRLTPSDPGVAVGPATVADGIVPLDEATFQALLASVGSN